MKLVSFFICLFVSNIAIGQVSRGYPLIYKVKFKSDSIKVMKVEFPSYLDMATDSGKIDTQENGFGRLNYKVSFIKRKARSAFVTCDYFGRAYWLNKRLDSIYLVYHGFNKSTGTRVSKVHYIEVKSTTFRNSISNDRKIIFLIRRSLTVDYGEIEI